MILLEALGCAPHPDAPAVAASPIASADSVTFVAVGDVGAATTAQREVATSIQRVCATEGCAFGVMLGDNVYPAGPRSSTDPALTEILEQPFGRSGFPWYLVVGNHDYGQRGDLVPVHDLMAWTKQHPSFILPATRYQFSAGPVAFWVIDTDWAFWNGGADQGDWLEATSRQDHHPWKIAAGHHPIVSDGPHGDAGSYEGSPLIPFASGAALRAMFDRSVRGTMDVYLCGHDHSQQWIDDPSGTVMVVSGAGSKATPLTKPRSTSRVALDGPGFTILTAANTTLHAAYYGAAGDLRAEVTREAR